MISTCLPSTEWSEGGLDGSYNGVDFIFEFRLGDKEPISAVSLSVRGTGNPVETLMQITKQHGWYGFDCSTSDWLHHLTPSQMGWNGFRSLCNQIVREDALNRPQSQP